MVATKGTQLKERIVEAVEWASVYSKRVLVSEVSKIDPIAPLSFFHGGINEFFGERSFWTDSANDRTMVGIGICAKIISDQATDRFFEIEKEWQRLIDDAIIVNPYSDSGIGPVMLGGFSFDPLKKKTSLWENFPDSLFHIPKFMYSEINGQAYLTTNVVCTPEDDESLFNKVVEQRSTLFSSLANPSQLDENLLIDEQEGNPEQWMHTVDEIVEELKNDKLKKVVLARESRLTYTFPIQIEQVLANLVERQKDSFIFAFESNGDCFIGASPERLVKIEDRNMFTTCLAGSIPRGYSEEEDENLGKTLLTDSKSIIEHQYVVDMIKEAVEELCERVTLPSKPQLMKMRDIQHLYTPVKGKTKQGTSLLSLVDRLHPTPALGGLPKKAAVEKIREVEELDRGLYGAPLGWLDYKGNGDFTVSIRSGLIQGNEVSIFAGCGVVEDSVALSEYEETKVKFRPMLSALGGQEK